MEGAGNEFPERLEVLEHGLVGIVVVRRGIVHVGVIQTVLPMPACLMKARRSAISISRPRGVPSPCAIASPLTTPIGKSAAMIFQVACELINSRLSQDTCVGPRIAAGAPSSP